MEREEREEEQRYGKNAENSLVIGRSARKKKDAGINPRFKSVLGENGRPQEIVNIHRVKNWRKKLNENGINTFGETNVLLLRYLELLQRSSTDQNMNLANNGETIAFIY